MAVISATEARSNFSEVLGRIAYGKERVTIERRGRPLAVLLPIEELARLEARAAEGPAGASGILSAVADNIPGTIYQRVHHPDGREEYSYVSSGTREIFGVEPEAMFSDPATLDRAIHPEDREGRARAIAESARALSTYDVQYRVRTPAGETKWLHVIARPERRADGAMVWTGITLDVTADKRTEEALRQSEARLRDLIDGSIEGIMIHRDHKPLLVNEAWAAIHGYTVEEVLAIDSVVDLISPLDRRRLIAHRDARLRGEEAPTRYEYRALHKDGSEIWLEHLVRVVDWRGAAAIQTVAIDITERKSAEAALEQARDELERRVEERTRELHATNRALEEEAGTRRAVEERLRESERDLRNLIEGSVQGILIVTEDRKPRFANQACAEIFGFESSAELLTLENTLPLIAPYEVARLDEFRKPHFADDERPIGYEFDGVRKDGATIRLQCMARTMTWKGERVAQVTLYDITERERAERALRESEARFRLLTEIVPVGIFETDAQGHNTFVNDKWCELAGLSPEQASGSGWVAALHPEDRERVSTEWYAAYTNHEMFRSEYRFQRPDGGISWLFGQGLNVTDAAGHTTGFVGTITDITERRKAEERLRQAQKMEAVGQLTGGVAHDFNNLLAVIVGNAELLGERLGVADRQVAAVLRAAGRGAELTQRLLAFSRRQPLKPQAIDLASRVAGMTELLTRTLGATIEISVASTPGLWRAAADPGQLENALLNLAINARDAMPEGGRLSISSANASLKANEIAALLAGQAPEAALEAALEPGDPGKPRDYVVLSVSDSGTGMSPAVLARVFEPFFTTKDVGQGSGLGLSMVYGFTRQSGGFLAIESAPGHGTTVRLYLPRAAAAAPTPEAGDRADQLPRGHGETVLLIEDTRDVRELAIALLENLNYRVLAAANATEAGALLADNPGIDLLLADVTLPGGRSGPDFAETARRHNPALKVLFMSGYPAEALMPRAGDSGRDTPLLPKPFRKAALAKAVRNALDDGDEVYGTE